MECMYCGAQIPDGLKFCTACGAALPVEAAGMSSFEDTVANAEVQQPEPLAVGQQQYQQPSYQQQPEAPQSYQQQGQGYQQPYGQAQPAYAAPAQQVTDSGSIGWAILGFFIPLVGLILFLVWKNTKPKCAKMAGIGALVGVCINIAYMVFGGGLMLASMH